VSTKTRCVAVMAVGASDISDLVSGERASLPGAPQHDIRTAEDQFAELTDEDLLELLPSRRFAPALLELCAEHPGDHALILVSTRQPDTVNDDYRSGDTFAVADTIRRMVEVATAAGDLRFPDVRIHELQVANVNEPTEELEAALRGLFDPFLDGRSTKAVRLVDIQPGGTPAMRLLIEREMADTARRRQLESEVRYRSRDRIIRRGLLRVIEADLVERVAARQIVDSVEGGRFFVRNDVTLLPESVREPVTQLIDIGKALLTRSDATGVLNDATALDEQVRQKLRNCRPETARGNIEIRLGVLRSAERENRIEDALVAYATITEHLPLVLADQLAKQHLGRKIHLDDLIPANLSRCCQRSDLRRAPGLVEAAQYVAHCASQKQPSPDCDICRLDSTMLNAFREAETGRKAATRLRSWQARPLLNLRNGSVHESGSAPTRDDLDKEIKRLTESGLLGKSFEPRSLSSIARKTVEELLDTNPADPIGDLQREIRRLLESAGLLADRRGR